MSKVTLNVSGTRFEINCKCLEEEPFQRLPLMVKEAMKDGRPLEFNIDRPVERFSAIIAYYQTGELHIPAGVCPGAFQKELLYWDIDSDNFSDCCMVRYISFLDEQATARKFRHEVLRTQSTVPTGGSVYVSVKSGQKIATYRRRMWNIIDNNESSVFAKMYFIFLFLLIMTSIFSLALSTVESFKRQLTKCEMLEYLEYTKSEDLKIIKKFLGNPSCESMVDFADSINWNKYYWYYFDDDDYDDYASEENQETTTGFTTAGFGPATSPAGNKKPAAPPPGGGTAPPILASTKEITSFTDTTTARTPNKDNQSGRHPPRRIEIPNLSVHSRAFDIIDIILMVFFTLDLLLRLTCCPSLLKYFISVINIVDIVALVGTYIHVIVTTIKKDQKYVDNWLDIIVYLQVLRILRLFRLIKNVSATKVLVYAVKQSFKDLLILLMFLFIAVCTFASIVYFAEDRAEFTSIPTSWWWALVTLTTVGYGDLAPKSGLGRLVGSVCAVTGVILISLTLPIFVNNFLMLYQYAMVDEVLQKNLEQNARQSRKLPLPQKVENNVSIAKTDAIIKKTGGNTLTVSPM